MHWADGAHGHLPISPAVGDGIIVEHELLLCRALFEIKDQVSAFNQNTKLAERAMATETREIYARKFLSNIEKFTHLSQLVLP